MAKHKFYWEVRGFHFNGEPLKEGIESFHFSADMPGNGSFGNNGDVPASGLAGIYISRENDRWSPALVQFVSSGKHLPKVVIKARAFQGTTPTQSIRMTMTDVTLVSFQSSKSNDGISHEQFGISYTEFETEINSYK